MTTATQPTTRIYDRIIGKHDDHYYLLQSIRALPNGEQRIEAMVLNPLTQGNLDNALDGYDYKSAWQDAVANGYTERSLSDWIDREADTPDASELFTLAPSRYSELVGEYESEEDFEYLEEYDSGRCFNLDIKWEKLYEPNLWQIIKKILQDNPR